MYVHYDNNALLAPLNNMILLSQEYLSKKPNIRNTKVLLGNHGYTAVIPVVLTFSYNLSIRETYHNALFASPIIMILHSQ